MKVTSTSAGEGKKAVRRWIAPRRGGYRPGEFSATSGSIARSATPPAGGGGVKKPTGRSRVRS